MTFQAGGDFPARFASGGPVPEPPKEFCKSAFEVRFPGWHPQNDSL